MATGPRVLSREVWYGFIVFLDLAAYSSHRNRRRGRRGIQSTCSFGHAADSKKASSKVESTAAESSNGTTNKSEFCCWLMKSEPESRFENGIDVKFGIEDLKAEPDATACWDGVRNYQARNFMRDQMKVGQKAFFYHSNTKIPGIAAIVEIVKESYVDHTQFDRKDPHYDSSAKKDNPRWFMVDVKYERMLKRYIPLPELKEYHLEHKASGGPLKNVALFTRARLSVQPLTKEEWDFIVSLEDKDPL